MMIEFFKIFPKKKKEFLVLDFGQNSVKGLVFEITPQREIKKFGQAKIERFGVFRARDFQLEIIKKAVENLIAELKIRKKIKKLKVIVGGFPDIFQAKVIRVSYQRKDCSRKIGRGEEEEIYQKIFKKGERKLINQLQKEAKIEILKKKILEKRISGYQVPSLMGFRGEKLDFKVLFIFSARENLKIISSLLRTLRLREPKIFHQVEGLIKLNEIKKIENRIFVDIGGKTTQVFYFKDGLELVESFPFGGDDFTQAIAHYFGISNQEAENLKVRLIENQLSSEVRKEIEKVISPAVKKWLKLFKKLLESKDKRFFGFSKKISFLGGGSKLVEIKKEIEKIGFELRDLKIEELPLKNKTKMIFSTRELPSLFLALVNYEEKNL